MEIREKSPWQVRMTSYEIDLRKLDRNFVRLAKLAKHAEIVALLKSDAYGHSLVPIADHLEHSLKTKTLHGFGVALIEEGIQLRQHGIQRPIYVLSGVQRADEEIVRCLETCRLTAVISNLRTLKDFVQSLQRTRAQLSVHLKFNTGMNRLGIEWQETAEAIRLVKQATGLEVAGILSHYAASEAPNAKQTLLQTKRFRQILREFRAAGIDPRYHHLANSFGLANDCYPEGNLVRLGIHLFGHAMAGLEPVGRWCAEVYSVRDVAPGEGIGYGPMYRTRKKTKIAILGVGYGDGYPRSLSNKSDVLILGQRCRVLGAVSMDLIAVDVSKVPRIPVGTKAVLLGKDRKAEITAVELAERSNTIPWEIVTRISPRVPRVFQR